MDLARFQAVLDRQIGRAGIVNIVTGVWSKDARVDLVGAAGKADAAADKTMTSETPYFLASITKMYTAAVILKLHEQKRLSLDEPLSTFLPASILDGIHTYGGVDYSRQIKVHQLVSQTSGIADYEADKLPGGQSILDRLKQGEDVGLDTQAVLALTRRLSSRFAPGTPRKAHYSNTNYRLLGEIIQAVTGQSPAEAFQHMIFAPLGLSQTYVFPMESADARPKPATIYLKDRPAIMPKYLASNITDGSLVSTVRECMAFLRGFFEGKLFNAALLGRMTAQWNPIFFPMQYGYGMMRVSLPRVFSPFQPFPELIGHSGATGSFAYYSPAKGLYLAGTVNQIAAPSRPIRLMMQLVNAIR